MENKDEKRKRGRPQGRTPTTVIFGRVEPELGEALDEYIDSLRPKPTLTSVLKVALQDYLEKHGFWPRNKKRQGR